MARMTGKIALVTGGGGGIGGALAEIFCAAGASVLLVDRDAGALARTAETVEDRAPGAALKILPGDVTDADHAVRAVACAIELFGGLNVLVNNAAIRNIASVADSARKDWDALLSVNLLGSVNFTKASLPALRESGKGAIVNVSSVNGVMGRKHWAIYDATKAALLALTRTLACEEAEHNIRVNAVCAAATLTPFTVGRAIERGLTEADLLQEKRSDNLLRRWARPVEMAYPILWLASDEASFMTGATVMVDGGRSIL